MAKSQFPPLLHLSFVLQQRCDSVLVAELGVGLSAVRIMSALSPTIPTSQRVIAMQLKQTEANVSRQLQAMKRQGLVIIKPNKKDKRRREVTLSHKGSSRYEQAEKLLVSQQQHILDVLSSSQIDAIESAAQKII